MCIGESGSNAGIIMDCGDTTNFIGCSFEGINSGTSPLAVPTAIKIAYNDIAQGCAYSRFYGITIEACTRGVHNNNDLIEIYGIYSPGSPYYSDTGQIPSVQISGQGATINSSVTGTYFSASDETACYILNPLKSSTRKAVILSTSGFSNSYNGTGIINNITPEGTQANTSLPSWFVDIGGTYPGSGIGASDTFAIHRRDAGASTWDTQFYVVAGGYIKPVGGYKSVDGTSGATGTFTTADSKTVTVKNGIITGIV